MKRTLFFISAMLLFVDAFAEFIYHDNQFFYQDHTLHLIFTLDTIAKEATLGTGYPEEHNALAYPPLDDPYWNAPYNLLGHVVVPETLNIEGESYTVVAISPYAFYRTTSIYSIKLPGTIRSIGHSSFCWAVNLQKINIPEGVDGIYMRTFELCRELDTITLPSTITNIGGKAFFNCSGLKQINIPGNCLSIGEDAFTWDDSLSTLIIEDGDSTLKLAPAYEFGLDYEGKGFQYLHTRALYTSPFYRGLFADCDLKNIYIGRNLQTEYPGQKNYSPFEDVRCSYWNQYDSQVLSRTGKYLNQVTFGNKVTRIPDSLFYSAYIPTGVVLPPNVKYIGVYAFCQSISYTRSITIPATCDTIGTGAFSASSSYSSILKYIDCRAINPPIIKGNYPVSQYTFLSVPSGSGILYRNDSIWKGYTIIDPADEMVSINVRYGGSLYGRLLYEDIDVLDVYRLKLTGILNADDLEVINSMKNLYDLDLSGVTNEDISLSASTYSHLEYYRAPNTVNQIAYGQYRNIALPDTLIIPSNIISIANRAFPNSTIKHLIIQGATEIEDGAFDGCTLLHSIDAQGSGASIGSNAFNTTNSSLEEVIIGKGVYVQENAFENCPSLKRIILKDSVSHIGHQAFANTPIQKIVVEGNIGFVEENILSHADTLIVNNTKAWCESNFISEFSNPISYSENVFFANNEKSCLTIPSNITVIGNYAFSNYHDLQSLTLNEGVSVIGAGAFKNCSGLNVISLPTTLDSISSSAFQNCSVLSQLTLPQQLEKISDSCFYNCQNLLNINFPTPLKEIGVAAFANCENLQTLLFPPSLKSIGKEAFRNCRNINDIKFPSSIRRIEERAFDRCEQLSNISFPYHLEILEEYAFANCSNLKTMKAFWTDPLILNANSFDNINKKCCLWVPFGTAGRYYESGWNHIPLIEEGFYTLTIETGYGGNVKTDSLSVSNSTDVYVLDENNEAVNIIIEPDSSYFVKSLLLDSTDVTSQISLQNHQISILNIQDNKSISAEFEKFELGDVNADDHIDVGDIASVVNYIQENTVGTFIPEAADANHDKEIDVGDIVGEVNLIYDFANQATNHVIQKRKYASVWAQNYHVYADEVILSENNDMTVPIHLESNTSVYGFQMEFVIPEILTISTSSDSSYMINADVERLKNMNIFSVAALSEHHYQVLCSSTNGGQIQGSEGAILYITLHVNTPSDEVIYSIPVSCRLADANGNVSKVALNIDINSQIQTPTNIEIIDDSRSSDLNAIKLIENGNLMIVKDGVKYTVSGLRVF